MSESGGRAAGRIATDEPRKPAFRFTKAQSITLVFGCTILGAAAQILIKTGAGNLRGAGALEMLANVHLLAGYCLYGLSTVLLVLALRDGELSILYPVISLTFVWVTVLSSVLFGEAVTANKLAGIAMIVAGVGILGAGGTPAPVQRGSSG
ncbi:MAG: 4-amino-4-deoxy-L-arabinose-phosphoundecaprenol flippase subunit ArnE [Bryobacteraceae bacterium]|nr:4-amino-4-deoxy-L-arabinose-phosphoundecaprenol flippase subunit ArnE [Bryobacteraceae bacterium]